MTLCIAALANDRSEHKIVLASDLKLGNELHSTEAEFKTDLGFSDTLAALYAGPWSEAQDLKRVLKTRANSEDLSLDNFQRKLTEGVDDFKGLMNGIGKQNSDAQCVVAGFIEERPTIACIDINGVEVLPYYAVIGIGAYHADTILAWRKLTWLSSLERTLYCVYEAQRFGQLCSDVGKETDMAVLSLDASGIMQVDAVQLEGKKTLESWFKKFGPQYIDLLSQESPKDGLYRIGS
jgi:20S proteasome alpha/beta subunit